MTVELASLGSKVSRITVAKYMNQLGLRSKLSKKFKVTTNSKHNHLIINVLNRIFGYRTFKSLGFGYHLHSCQEGFLYLTTVLDLYDRKIIGWSLSCGMSVEETSLAAWNGY
jgi:transposase InsO family protein